MRQIIYDKVKYIADKYKGYIDTEDLMEGRTYKSSDWSVDSRRKA